MTSPGEVQKERSDQKEGAGEGVETSSYGPRLPEGLAVSFDTEEVQEVDGCIVLSMEVSRRTCEMRN